MKQTSPRISITHSALIWTGMVLALMGAIVAVVGVGGNTQFEASIGTIEFKTTHVGLVILSIGSILAGTVALKLPKGVQTFSGNREKQVRLTMIPAPFFLAIGILAVVILALSFFWGT